MNSCLGQIWWRDEHVRLNKRWCCWPACILKSILDRHHQTKLKLKFCLCLSNSCQKIFQNVVTWDVELCSRNTIFACFPMASLFSGLQSDCTLCCPGDPKEWPLTLNQAIHSGELPSVASAWVDVTMFFRLEEHVNTNYGTFVAGTNIHLAVTLYICNFHACFDTCFFSWKS